MHWDQLQVELMNVIPCRDCGNMIDPNSRGCPTCAMNLDAERMIDRFVFYGLFLGGILIAVIIVMLYFRHYPLPIATSTALTVQTSALRRN